jgi:acyl-CoA thioesterase I
MHVRLEHSTILSFLIAAGVAGPTMVAEAGQAMVAAAGQTTAVPTTQTQPAMVAPAANALWNSRSTLWNSTIMRGESVLFIRPEDGGPATGSLLLTPRRILSVASSDGRTVYREGKDYQYTPGSRSVSLPAGSAIPARTMKELTPPKGSQPFGLVRRDGRGDILFAAGHEYADLQVVVTYEHSGTEWKVPSPRLAERELPGTIAALRAGRPLKIVLFGDSISTGCNASKWANTAPFQPAYGELLVERLTEAYRSAITFRNPSEGGRASAWGLEHIAAVTAEKPDLVIIAWGMNDSTGEGGGIPVETFIANLRAQMAAVRKAQPKAEFILVASMLPNREWRLANPDRLIEYRDAMRKLVGPGVALADVSAVWEGLLARKPYLDLTGNGVNHPNDFGHLLYAEALSALLVRPQGGE